MCGLARCSVVCTTLFAQQQPRSHYSTPFHSRDEIERHGARGGAECPAEAASTQKGARKVAYVMDGYLLKRFISQPMLMEHNEKGEAGCRQRVPVLLKGCRAWNHNHRTGDVTCRKKVMQGPQCHLALVQQTASAYMLTRCHSRHCRQRVRSQHLPAWRCAYLQHCDE